MIFLLQYWNISDGIAMTLTIMFSIASDADER